MSDTAVTQGNVIQLSRGGGGRFDYSLGAYGTALAISTASDGLTQRYVQFGYHNGSNVFQPKTVINGFDGRVGIGTTVPSVALDVRGASIFNEAGADFDFRVEGDNNPNLFFVDASTDRIGIGTSTPAGNL